MIACAVVDLPEPLSPTMPKVVPRRTRKLTPSTAWTFDGLANRPRRPAGKCTTRSLTSSKDSAGLARATARGAFSTAVAHGASS